MQVNLNSCKDLIVQLFDNGSSYTEICQQLQAQHNVEISECTLKRRLQEWQITRRTKMEDTLELRARILYLFASQGYSDLKILPILKQEGAASRQILLPGSGGVKACGGGFLSLNGASNRTSCGKLSKQSWMLEL